MGSESSKNNSQNLQIKKDLLSQKQEQQKRKIKKKSSNKRKNLSIKKEEAKLRAKKSIKKHEVGKNFDKKKCSHRHGDLSASRKKIRHLNSNERAKTPDFKVETKEETTQLFEKELISPTSLNDLKRSTEAKSVQNNLYSVEEEPVQVERNDCEDTLIDPIEKHVDLKCRLISEQTSHASVSPKTAMCLAAALENDLSKGNKGARLFQMLKQKSHEWVVDETNVKKLDNSSKIKHQIETMPNELKKKLHLELDDFNKLKINKNCKMIVDNLTYELNKIGDFSCTTSS